MTRDINTKMPELIDKEVALKDMCELCGYCVRFENAMRSTHPNFVSDKCGVYKFLAGLPTIEAEPVRHGQWIFVGEETMHDGWTYRKHKCTECDYVTVEAKNFCQNCGAKMSMNESMFTDTFVCGKGGD